MREHSDTKLIIIDTMQKIREVGGEAYSYASDYEIVGKLKRFADKHCICVLTVHHTQEATRQGRLRDDLRHHGPAGLCGWLPADAEEKSELRWRLPSMWWAVTSRIRSSI